ncbi:MATE family efflux transporter [Culicoidibacter larvae]|uniref:Probable multidrug resistance protein NorM n=1 Tax=Culicoidibacter larvae TaxID=2579976 RepID=A0A5R8QGT9_9FIRM|nr:MATE family efflux transporter [Culicoidibacter larvae]TLG77225.1 MATE family efflux transporter [Culicoidibacter larvae]
MNKIDMTTGNERDILIKLSLPIIASNFIQTAFGMINMIWIGRAGSDAVSAIGTASFFINLATALSTLIIIGTGIRIAQSLGAGKEAEAEVYLKNSLILSVFISIVFSAIVGLLSRQLIGFFEMNNPYIEQMAVDYLLYSLIGMPFLFLTTTLTTVLTSYGNTKLTFQANTAGFVANIVLDPLLIFGFGIIPGFGVIGAAWATTLSRILTLAIMVIFGNKYIVASLKQKIDFKKMFEVCRISVPVTVQRVIFIFISIYMAKIIVQFGTEAIAVQKIGIQIESISYMTIGGIQGAIAAFVGQNYGAKHMGRINSGFNSALKLVTVFGIIISLLFILFPKPLFSIFIDEPDVIEMGVGYMQALGFSQLFMCIELLSVGAFNGMGKTYAPPIVSIIFSAARIPLAILLSGFIGLEGIWISISVTSIVKGILLTAWFKIISKREMRAAKAIA